MSNYLYLVINLGSFFIPFIFSFHPKLLFYREWKYFWPACIPTAVIFILWDNYFTRIGVWGFNREYVTGIEIFNLPVEECLFFICIPYSCMFTYHCLNVLSETDYFKNYSSAVTILVILVCFSLGIFNVHKLYTSVTLLATSVYLAIIYFLNNKILSRFYFAYLVILIPFFITNGILTGSFIDGEVVWYNNNENLGIRMFTIPVEDSIYALLLLLMNVSGFEVLNSADKKQNEKVKLI
jgi:lycopene cyclase domain-containing protein